MTEQLANLENEVGAMIDNWISDNPDSNQSVWELSRSIIYHVLNAIASDVGEDDWRPIKTAPKNQVIDVWTAGHCRVCNVKWLKGAWREWALGDFDRMEWVKLEFAPTHWMYPPEPPIER